jgi:hypothetical protein
MICQGAQQDPPHPGSSTAGSVASSLCCGGRRGHHAPAQSRPSEGEIMLGDPTRWPGHWKRRSSPWVKGPASTPSTPTAGRDTSELDMASVTQWAAFTQRQPTPPAGPHLCPATEPTFVDVGVVPHRPSGRGSSTPWYAVFRKPSNALRSFDLTTSTAPAWTPSAASRMDNTGSRPLEWRLSTKPRPPSKPPNSPSTW